MSNLAYVGIFVILCIFGILYSLWASARRDKIALQLRASGIPVQAEVTGLEFIPAVWSNDSVTLEARYSLTYRFYVDQPGEGSIPYAKTITASRQIGDSGDSLEVGLHIPVLYLPGDPAVSMLEANVRSQSPTGMNDYVKVFFMFTTAAVLLALLLNVMHW